MSQPSRIAVVAGARTPFLRAGGVLAAAPAHELGRVAAREAMERAEILPSDLDEVIFGNIAQPVEATNVARAVALRAGVPHGVPAYTVNRNCASALQAIDDACLRIRAGEARLVLAGGVESMSRIPVLFPDSIAPKLARMARAKSFAARATALASFRAADFRPIPALPLGLVDYASGLGMGETAERLAREFDVAREAQDRFALESHRRASAAEREGRLAAEIAPVPVPPRYDTLATRDDGIRHEQTMEALARLKPVFDRRYGTVTAGNASQITDGAAALVLADEAFARERSLPVLGWIRGSAHAALDPARMGLGPVFATPRALERAGVAFSDLDLFEINEAFAAQVLAVEIAFASAEFARRELGLLRAVGEIDPARRNVNGGAIALGHPVGASGARLVLTLLHELRRRDRGLGLVALCVGGGQGSAMVVERA